MAFVKEKERLSEILVSILNIEEYNESMEILDENYREFSTIINLLYKRHPNVFSNIYNHDFKEIKGNKMFVKKSFSDMARQNNFIVFRDSLKHAVERTIDYIVDYI